MTAARPALVATGRLADFRCAYGRLRPCGDGVRDRSHLRHRTGGDRG